ncbi:MAG: alpha/beta hydrolase, partial [Acetobacteraceae bacterium]|nr:alpha/beta hydrolase [Acetobacteraceae bacterium]
MTSIEPIVGRYLNTAIGGRTQRVYFEEAGAGIPLLCLHTAGSDGRQYRGLMNDASITSQFRVIAFDMPWHGKSSPPDGWWEEEYKLTRQSYAVMIMEFAAALGLDRPVVMGCSIGGRIVLELAAAHGPQLRGVIGLQSAAHTDGYYDLSWLHRSDVHGGEMAGAIISGLMAPHSPAKERWETIWHYMQSGPGVFKGDLNFYTLEGDVRDRLSHINTDICPMWLLTGDYDYSATPEATRATAAHIPGAQVMIMQQLGHFPMSENPERFQGYLRPVLDA